MTEKTEEPCTCPDLKIHEWIKESWQEKSVELSDLQQYNSGNWAPFSSQKSKICIVRASANEISKCERCKEALTDALFMPKRWWEKHYRRLNGYFECESDETGFNSWAFFEIKLINDPNDYTWIKLNIFTRYFPNTNRTIVVLFDNEPPKKRPRQPELTFTSSTLLAPLTRRDMINLTSHPLWIYTRVASTVVSLEDKSVWDIRDLIRPIEKQPPLPENRRPQPKYRDFHDRARHATHVTETLEVAAQVLAEVLTEHDALVQDIDEFPSLTRAVARDIRRSLSGSSNMISNLKCRAVACEKRLLNEIQLAFHTVAQHDAGTSVEIGKATRDDSIAMKTVAYVTLTFLPPTFISSIFSMSFFNFDPKEGEEVSWWFWVYWVIAIPLTLLTFVVWYYWHRTLLPERGEEGEEDKKDGGKAVKGKGDEDGEYKGTKRDMGQKTDTGFSIKRWM